MPETTPYESSYQLPFEVQALVEEAQEVWRIAYNNAIMENSRNTPWALREAWRAVARRWRYEESSGLWVERADI